jgi:hypothetical protein
VPICFRDGVRLKCSACGSSVGMEHRAVVRFLTLKTTYLRVLHEILGFRKWSLRCVLHVMTENDAPCRIIFAEELLQVVRHARETNSSRWLSTRKSPITQMKRNPLPLEMNEKTAGHELLDPLYYHKWSCLDIYGVGLSHNHQKMSRDRKIHDW